MSYEHLTVTSSLANLGIAVSFIKSSGIEDLLLSGFLCDRVPRSKIWQCATLTIPQT